MKKILPFAIFVLFILGCQKAQDTSNDNIVLTPFVLDNYYHDAKQLYFDEIFKDSTHQNYMNTTIDENEVDKILKIIQAVYDSDYPERDTIFDIYQIHGYYCYSFSSVDLKVDTSQSEIKNLANSVFPTGEPNLDNLLTTYHFDSVSTRYGYPEFSWLTIYTDDEYNLIPLERDFSELSSVEIAEFNKGCIGDGNTITLSRNNYSSIITFSIGAGDCPSGCIYHRYWEFEVANGIAKFKRVYE